MVFLTYEALVTTLYKSHHPKNNTKTCQISLLYFLAHCAMFTLGPNAILYRDITLFVTGDAIARRVDIVSPLPVMRSHLSPLLRHRIHAFVLT